MLALHVWSPVSSAISRLPDELRWLWKWMRPFVHLHLASFLCMTAGSFLALLLPLVLRWIIDQLIPQRQLTLLYWAAFFIFVGLMLRTAFIGWGNYLTLTGAQKMGMALRIKLLQHLNELSADYYDTVPAGAVMYPLHEPVEEASFFGSDLLAAMLRMILTVCMTLSAMSVLSPSLTLIVLPFVFAFLYARQYFRKRLAANSDCVQCNQLVTSAFLTEHFSWLVPIQLLGRRHRQERKAFQLLARTLRSQQQLVRTGLGFSLCTSLAVVLATSAVIGYGSCQVVAATMSTGTFVAFYGFVMQLFDPLSGAAELYARAQKAFASVRQLQATFALAPGIMESASAVLLREAHPDVEFIRVEFHYPRQHTLLSIASLRIRSGEHVAVAGENGAGKSTLVKLIARVYDVHAGSIHVGGEDVRNIGLESLRRAVSYLPREAILFSGTLSSNLRFVSTAVSDDQLWDAIRLVGLFDFVSALPDGLQQKVGPSGCQLSGGERQRLAIARALLQRPQILILDEATSCLDQTSEAAILDRLRHVMQAATLIVISHRASTFSAFGRVLVLSSGRIIEDGSPTACTSAAAVCAPFMNLVQ
jgi:subfamily B ATP-binding cassette protein MsbA